MTKEQKKVVDKIIIVMFCIIFLPFVLLYLISLSINSLLRYLFDKQFYPFYKNICKLVRKPIPNSTVHIKGEGDNYFKRINEKLLTIKEAKDLGKQYEDKGYEVHLQLSEY
jgi:hypothetical protein